MSYELLLYALMPDLFVVVGIFLALGLDYTWLRGRGIEDRNRVVARVATWSLLLGLGAMAQVDFAGINVGEGQLIYTQTSITLKALVFVLAAVVVELCARVNICRHVSEFYALLLLSTLGMGLVITGGNLLSAFVALELTSLSLYAMTALWQHRRASAEAALKYLAFGGVSAAFLLFGLSYLYGATGTLELVRITQYVAAQSELPPLIVLAYVFILIGIGFKIALAPFHFWAPDVYQNAPTPAAAWVASGSKIAAVVLLINLLAPAFGDNPAPRIALGTALAALAVLSMVWGNLAALRQTNLKRLLAYSAVANAGYLLVGLVAFTPVGRASVLFFALVYSLASIGAFGIVSLLADRLDRDAEIDDFRGCWKTMPILSGLFFVFVLSMASIPPLAGFVGKFYLFYAAIGSQPDVAGWSEGWYWLVGLALVMSVVSLYYYLKILKPFLVFEPAGAPLERPANAASATAALAVLALLIVIMGVYPQPFIDIFRSMG